MKPAEVFREFIYPLTELAILLAILFFWLILVFAKFAVSFVPVAGLIAAAIVVAWSAPAAFRYLLFLLEARADGRKAPALDAELFGLANKLWSLSPLVLIALLIWGGIFISAYGPVWMAIYSAAILFLLPASIAILAITHSPVQSLNPVAIFRMIRICGIPYALIPGIFVVLNVSLRWLAQSGAPQFVIEWYFAYQVVLLFTLTGAVLYAKDVALEVGIELPLEASAEQIAGDLEKEREKVASHAYGFISRGNRDGGFAHILDWIQKEPDINAASAWFFAAMMKWERKQPALYFAQNYFAHLIQHENDALALKLLSTCLHVDPAWKPTAEHRQHALDLAEKYQRDDLLRALR